MESTRAFLRALGFPGGDLYDLPSSAKRFPDGAEYRVELPSVEGPAALAATLREIDRRGLTVHRVSQGSGIMLLTDGEIRDMVAMCAERGIELSLFVGPRGTWDVGATPLTPAGRAAGLRHEGADQLVYAMEDLKRGASLGLRGALVADEGLLWLTKRMKEAGELPRDFVVKCSVQMMASNPVSVRIMQDLGADTYNVPTGLTLPKLAAIRAAVDIPLDVYVEGPDTLGGFIRHYEIAELIRLLAPVYIKFGLRNHPDVYPSGEHLEGANVALCVERARRAALGLQMVERYCPDAATSALGAAGLGIPVPGTGA
ncbi:U32 family peptidase [Paenibacillus sp. MWE-103]|uniref:U32 family peptidase n=1 Tax=Paenibacillus artemisiicola TaxID=1172618 RepID=A0ABS3WFN3_9BACL|nr:U32 family peptidase [Paenibacillus artemisiicola]MBO7746920.1 U32 family peptidase [Paenibacillus artemisiicola]